MPDKPLKILKHSSTRKYQCPDCQMTVRATKDVRLICADCGVLMDKVFDYSKSFDYTDK